MAKPKTTVVVVPCYNEAGRFSVESFNNFRVGHPHISFLFVDDGSSDDTFTRLSEFCDDSGGQSRVISLSINSGKAEAVRQGVLQVVDEGYEYIGYWDADLSTPLDEIDHLLFVLEQSKADVVIGSRMKILGHEIHRRLYRHLTGRVFATAASHALDLPVYDTQCGAKIFYNNHLLKVVFQDPFLSSWSFDVEVLKRYTVIYQLSETTMNILEVPLKRWMHITGSKVKVADFFYAIYDLYRIKYHYNKKQVLAHYRQLIASA